MTPKEQWALREQGRGEVDGITYVVYSDDEFAWAVAATVFDAPTSVEEYSDWCLGEGKGVSDLALCARIASACGVRGFCAAGNVTWVRAG